ncbi:MAG: radical SAM protein [Aequorivita antarctica]
MKENMRIVLADSHGTIMGKDQSSANLSLLYLASYIREKADFPIEFKYLPQSKTEKDHFETLEKFKPHVYAVSFTSYAAVVTYYLINKIKELYPEILIVCGGPHATPSYEDIFKNSQADICVIGEGEQTFYEIVANFDSLDTYKQNIDGIAYMENGKCFKTSGRDVIDEVDSIPFPARDLIVNDEFVGLVYSKGKPNTEMVVTRGCPFRCVFCANPVFRLKKGPLFRSRSPQNIAAEAEELYQLGYREIFIHSDELNLSLDWSIELCKALYELGHEDLYFQTHLRVQPMSEEFAYWLKKANFWMVKIGIESTSDRVLAGIKKKMSHDKTIRACKMLSDQGIKVFGFLMLFNYWEEDGELQHDTIAETKATIKEMYKLWRKGYLHYISWEISRPVQGSEFYDIALKHGMIDENYYPNDHFQTFDFIKGITKREFNRIFRESRIQQAILILTSGNIEWRNYRAIYRKGVTIINGIKS